MNSAIFNREDDDGLNYIELKGKRHAILCSVGFLILLPIGVLVARYSRTYFSKWFYAHWIIQLLIAGPVIFTGWGLGHRVTSLLGTGHYQDPHQKIGLALLILYILQLTLGGLVHFFKFPAIFRGHRAPHNYLHILLGIAIFILAAYQVHYGLYTEWPTITGLEVPDSAKHAWLAVMILFWSLWIMGMAFLPRQIKQEKEYRSSLAGSNVEKPAIPA